MNAADFLASKRLTQMMVAKKLGCTRANVSLWFSGETSPNVATIERLTNALNDLGADTNYTEVFNALWQTRQERKKEGK